MAGPAGPPTTALHIYSNIKYEYKLSLTEPRDRIVL